MHANRSPRVSVVIPLYNRERYVGEAIESILAQSFADFELLLIDDGSSDRSGEVIRSYRDPRIRVLVHPRNLGVPRTRNDGIDAARGLYLAFLDSDDVARPTRLARQAAFLDSHRDHAAVGAWVDWMDARGRRLRRVKRRPPAAADVAAMRLFMQGIENTTCMARTAVLREYRHDERYDVGEDFELWSRLAGSHRIANLPEVLVRRRAHDRQVSRSCDERLRRHRRSVYARQLADLGVAFEAEDLERHDLLRNMRKSEFTPDRAFVNWAEAWLLGLQAANRRAARYPEPHFAHQLGAYWIKVCTAASGALGWLGVTRRLRRSPLLSAGWQGLRKEIGLNASRPWARLVGQIPPPAPAPARLAQASLHTRFISRP